MDQEKILIKITTTLSKLKIPYMIVGGIAAIFYGRPRFTHDLDIIIKTNISDIEKIIKAFEKEFYISQEAVEEAIKRQSMFNIIDKKSVFKIDFWLLKKDKFEQTAFKKRKKKRVFKKQIFLISPEDLIIEKLSWYKQSEIDKHLEDAKGIIQIQGKKLNFKYLKKQAKALSILGILNEILGGK